jgi:hypothetical protein
MDNKVLYIYVFITLLLSNVKGYSQDKDFLSGVKSTLRESSEVFNAGDESDIWSSGTILATNTVNPGARINFKATEKIIFSTGFKAVKGSSVKAKIENQDVFKSTEINTQGLSDRISSFNSPIAVYPNPSNGTVKIETNGLDFPVHLNVFDYTGKVILKKEIRNKLEQIDLTIYPKGIYVIKLDVTGKVYMKNIVLQ